MADITIGPESQLPDGTVRVPVSFGGKTRKRDELLPHLLHKHGLAHSVTEARRLIKDGAVEEIGEMKRSVKGDLRVHRPPRKLSHEIEPLYPGMVIRVGEQQLAEIIDVDWRRGAGLWQRPFAIRSGLQRRL